MSDETLEPIQPVDETPYGALIIGNDVLCTPTSLCTWSDTKPAMYCQLPQHTLNPVCKKISEEIGVIGCYDDPTCGGIVRQTTTKRILAENPQYMAIIKKHEKKLLNRRKQQKSKQRLEYIFIIIFILLIFGLIIVMGQKTYKKYKKLNKPRSVSRTPMRSTSRKTLSGAGKIARPLSK